MQPASRRSAGTGAQGRGLARLVGLTGVAVATIIDHLVSGRGGEAASQLAQTAAGLK